MSLRFSNSTGTFMTLHHPCSRTVPLPDIIVSVYFFKRIREPAVEEGSF